MSAAEDLAQAQEMCAAYVAAEKAVIQGKSYSIGNRTLTRENLSEIRKGRAEWCTKANNLASGNGGIKVQRIVPRDN